MQKFNFMEEIKKNENIVFIWQKNTLKMLLWFENNFVLCSIGQFETYALTLLQWILKNVLQWSNQGFLKGEGLYLYLFFGVLYVYISFKPNGFTNLWTANRFRQMEFDILLLNLIHYLIDRAKVLW